MIGSCDAWTRKILRFYSPINTALGFSEMNEHVNERWCVIANIKSEVPYGPGGIEKKSGVKKFKAGARVSVVGSYPGSCESIIVIGQERNSGKFINYVLRVDKIENLRVKKIYRPKTLEFLEKFSPNGASIVRTKEEAEQLCGAIPEWVKGL